MFGFKNRILVPALRHRTVLDSRLRGVARYALHGDHTLQNNDLFLRRNRIKQTNIIDEGTNPRADRGAEQNEQTNTRTYKTRSSVCGNM